MMERTGDEKKIAALSALLAALACGAPANAHVVAFSFSGAGTSGKGLLTYVPNVSPADPNPACGTPANNPCRADPSGAFAITGISGTFSDPADGVNNAAITGLVPINPADERDPVFDPLVPTSLSFVDFAPGQDFTYNNLFFPNGSPIDCAHPFSRTLFDVFGVAFTVAGGYTVNLWGDGDVPVLGLTHGITVISLDQELVNQFNGVNAAMPERPPWRCLVLGCSGSWVCGGGPSVPNRKFAILESRPIRDTSCFFSVACLSPPSAAECGELRGQDTGCFFSVPHRP